MSEKSRQTPQSVCLLSTYFCRYFDTSTDNIGKIRKTNPEYVKIWSMYQKEREFFSRMTHSKTPKLACFLLI